MKKLVVIAVIVSFACKQERSEPQPKPRDVPVAIPVAPPPANLLACPMFWSIEKDGITSYAFGTVHLGVGPERLPAVVHQKLVAVPAFAMERDMHDANASQRMTSRTPLRTALGADYWAKLEKLVGAPTAKALDGYQPYVAVITIAKTHLPPVAMLDSSLLADAQAAKKSIVYLEPAGVALDALEQYVDLRSLKRTLDDPAHDKKVIEDVVAAYVSGDPEALVKVLDESDDLRKRGVTEEEIKGRMEALFYQRNERWTDPFVKMHAAGGGFVAVGSGHLVGKRSMLDLLEQRGYNVTRVTPCTP